MHANSLQERFHNRIGLIIGIGFIIGIGGEGEGDTKAGWMHLSHHLPETKNQEFSCPPLFVRQRGGVQCRKPARSKTETSRNDKSKKLLMNTW